MEYEAIPDLGLYGFRGIEPVYDNNQCFLWNRVVISVKDSVNSISCDCTAL